MGKIFARISSISFGVGLIGIVVSLSIYLINAAICTMKVC